MESQAFSIAEAAKRAGISRSTIYAEIHRGKLLVRKIGRRSIITDEDYRRWLDGLPVIVATAAARQHRHPGGKQPQGIDAKK